MMFVMVFFCIGVVALIAFAARSGRAGGTSDGFRTKREGDFSRSSSPEVRSPRTSSRGGSRLLLGIRRERREQGATEAAGARKVPAVFVVVHGSWSWLGDDGAGRCPFPGTIGPLGV